MLGSWGEVLKVLGVGVVAAAAFGCGGGPAASTTVGQTMAAPEAPNPCAANPCAATTIDPTVNPCAGAAAERSAAEAKAAEVVAPVQATEAGGQ